MRRILSCYRRFFSNSYRDILPYFIRGNIFSHFGDEMVRVVLEHPEYWDLETLQLIREPLWLWTLLRMRDLIAQDSKESHVWGREEICSFIDRGLSILKQGDLGGAMRVFAQLTEKVPNAIEGYTALAATGAACGQEALALKSIRMAGKIFKEQLDASHNTDRFRRSKQIDLS